VRHGQELDDRAPAASVIIAAYNGERVIGEQLESLTLEAMDRQPTADGAAPPRFEVIVADNGSSDATRAVVAGFEGRLMLRVVDASDRRGQAHARNIGAASAATDRFLFLDQDDVVMPGYVAAMCRALEEHPVVAAAMRSDRLNVGWARTARSLTQEVALPFDFGVTWAYGCTLGLRRDAFEAVGGFDPSLRPAGEDVDLCIRLAEAGYTIELVDRAVLQYRFPSTLRSLFLQGRRYGLGHIDVCLRHRRSVGMRDIAGWARSAAAAASWSLPGRSMTRRGQGAGALGRRLGLLEGAARHPWRLRRGSVAERSAGARTTP
jgi:GT2 family glycosyltransferase